MENPVAFFCCPTVVTFLFRMLYKKRFQKFKKQIIVHLWGYDSGRQMSFALRMEVGEGRAWPGYYGK